MLGRSAWPSDGSVLVARPSDAGRRVTTSAFQPPDWRRLICVRVAGGDDAPTRARRSVLSQLEGHIAATTTSDAGLLISELVTNSVIHANVGPRRALTAEVTTLDDRLRIAVTDPGSRLRPRILPPDPETPGGLGLLLVDELCETWGVWQDLGPTCVWCELLLDQSAPPVVTAPVGNAPRLRAVQARCAAPRDRSRAVDARAAGRGPDGPLGDRGGRSVPG
jgi:anti-sigma regulatory factor (Ser/Thr protein kinase)